MVISLSGASREYAYETYMYCLHRAVEGRCNIKIRLFLRCNKLEKYTFVADTRLHVCEVVVLTAAELDHQK